jgi:hypothetical protein
MYGENPFLIVNNKPFLLSCQVLIFNLAQEQGKEKGYIETLKTAIPALSQQDKAGIFSFLILPVLLVSASAPVRAELRSTGPHAPLLLSCCCFLSSTIFTKHSTIYNTYCKPKK